MGTINFGKERASRETGNPQTSNVQQLVTKPMLKNVRELAKYKKNLPAMKDIQARTDPHGIALRSHSIAVDDWRREHSICSLCGGKGQYYASPRQLAKKKGQMFCKYCLPTNYVTLRELEMAAEIQKRMEGSCE